MKNVMCQVTTLAVVVTLVFGYRQGGRFQVALEDRRQEANGSLLQDACEDDEEDARAKDQKEALVNNQEDATGVVLHKLKCR
jgi:hypothetical protein